MYGLLDRESLSGYISRGFERGEVESVLSRSVVFGVVYRVRTRESPRRV